VLGYYDPGFFLGGRMALDKPAAEAAVARVATPLGLSVEDAAWGIHKVVTESMAAAARVHLVEKGKDPRRYAMVGFGGAGPAHAAGVARVLGVAEVIIPPASGAASALGFLAAPLSFELVRSHPVRFAGAFDAGAVNGVLAALEDEGRRRLAEAGVARAAVTVERSADMRLTGQMHEIAVPLPAGAIDAGSLEAIRTAFATVYTARYTSPVWRCRDRGDQFPRPLPGPDPDPVAGRRHRRRRRCGKRKGTRLARFADGTVEAVVYDRYALVPGDRIEGPAIIEERESTTIVPPGDIVRVDETLNLRIAIGVAAPVQALVTAEMTLARGDGSDRGPTRSRWRSCGAGWSPWSRRCG